MGADQMSWEESEDIQNRKSVRDHPVYRAVYIETFNRLVAASMENDPNLLWSIYKNGIQHRTLQEARMKSKSGWGGMRGNGGFSREAHTSLKAELESIATIAHKAGVAACFRQE